MFFLGSGSAKNWDRMLRKGHASCQLGCVSCTAALGQPGTQKCIRIEQDQAASFSRLNSKVTP
jgi:hypothetical protein